MSMRQFVGAIATVLLLVGLAGVVWPVSVDGPQGDSLRCADGGLAASVPVTAPEVQGGVLVYDRSGELVAYDGALTNASGPTYRAAPWQAECSQALTVRTMWAATALVVSGVVLLGVLLVQRKPDEVPAG